MVSEENNFSMRDEIHIQYLERVYDNNALQNSVFEPYYADAHKIIWKEKYKDFLKLNDATKTKRITQINTYMHDLLTLMCSRFKLTDPHELDDLFKSNAEYRGDFLKHAHHVIMRLGMQKIRKKHPEKSYAGVLVNQTHKTNKFFEEKPLVFNLGGKQWSEKQVYAIASVYAIELALMSFEEGDINSFSSLQGGINSFVSGPDYSDIYGIKGAHKKHQNNRAIKRRAEKIYKEKRLFEHKNLHAAYEIYADLKKENITNISKSTLEAKWVPDFKKRFKSLK